MPIVELYTDGSCNPNPGPGGWGVVMKYGKHYREMKGGDPDATNNRMELLAAIKALEGLSRPCIVKLTTDSQYVIKGITQWIVGWRRRKWKTGDGEPVKNKDLWLRLGHQADRHDVEWIWVRGHNGHVENERADTLANEGRVEQRTKRK